jgi:hypothetical protein
MGLTAEIDSGHGAFSLFAFLRRKLFVHESEWGRIAVGYGRSDPAAREVLGEH